MRSVAGRPSSHPAVEPVWALPAVAGLVGATQGWAWVTGQPGTVAPAARKTPNQENRDGLTYRQAFHPLSVHECAIGAQVDQNPSLRCGFQHCVLARHPRIVQSDIGFTGAANAPLAAGDGMPGAPRGPQFQPRCIGVIMSAVSVMPSLLPVLGPPVVQILNGRGIPEDVAER